MELHVGNSYLSCEICCWSVANETGEVLILKVESRPVERVLGSVSAKHVIVAMYCHTGKSKI